MAVELLEPIVVTVGYRTVVFVLQIYCFKVETYATIQFYGEFKLAVDALLYAVYQKTHGKCFLEI